MVAYSSEFYKIFISLKSKYRVLGKQCNIYLLTLAEFIFIKQGKVQFMCKDYNCRNNISLFCSLPNISSVMSNILPR